MKPFAAFVLAGAAFLLAPLGAEEAVAQTPSGTEKLNAYVGCINRLSERSYNSRDALFQLGRQERADRQGADHLRHLHHLRHLGLPEERREGQCAGAARRRARSRRLGLCRGGERSSSRC